MNDHQHEEIAEILRKAFPPVNTGLRRDLWPAMLLRLGQPRFAVPWYDWALLGALVATLALFPQLILVFLYHL